VKATVQSDGAPFWLVLDQSINDGWHVDIDEREVDGPHPIDSFANGWLITPEHAGTFAVHVQWTPQRTENIALIISSLAVVLCLVLALRRPWRPIERAPDVPTLVWPDKRGVVEARARVARASPSRSCRRTVHPSLCRRRDGGIVRGAATLAAAQLAAALRGARRLSRSPRWRCSCTRPAMASSRAARGPNISDSPTSAPCSRWSCSASGRPERRRDRRPMCAIRFRRLSFFAYDVA
jgi:hypothetical protein